MTTPQLRGVICIDAGGVLYYKNDGGDETSVERNPIAGAVEWVTKLKEEGFKLYLVSFAGRKTASLTKGDMEKNFSGLFDGVFFVKNKLEKIAVCRWLGADVMVDDTAEILTTIKTGLYLGKAKEIAGVPTMVRVLFTGDPTNAGVGGGGDDAEVAGSWEEVHRICCGIGSTGNSHQPDLSIDVSKFVYADLSSVPPKGPGSGPGSGPSSGPTQKTGKQDKKQKPKCGTN